MDKIAQQLGNIAPAFEAAYAALEKQAGARGVNLKDYGHEKVAGMVHSMLQQHVQDAGLVPSPEEAAADRGHNKLAGLVPSPEEAGAVDDEFDTLMKLAYAQGQAMYAGFQDAAESDLVDAGSELTKTAEATLAQLTDDDLEKLAAIHAEDVLLYTGNVRNEEMIKIAAQRETAVDFMVRTDLIKVADLNDWIGARATEILAANGWDVDVLNEQYAEAARAASDEG